MDKPSTLSKATAKARPIEAKYGDIWSHGGRSRTQNTSFSRPLSASSPSGIFVPSPPKFPPKAPSPQALLLPVKRLTPAELQAKWEHVLCYDCDEKCHPTHRCKSKFYLLLGNKDEDVSEAQPAPIEGDSKIVGDVYSLHSHTRPSNPCTVQVLGRIGNKDLHILIDDGATHNFIQPSTMEKFGLAIKPISTFHIYVGNGHKLTSQWHYLAMDITIQGYPFLWDLYVLPIEGLDIVLGVQWLLDFSEVRHNYKT